MEDVKHILGIDFGAKMSGTTALCFLGGDNLLLQKISKGVDADKFIRLFLNSGSFRQVFIDAPLSLPAAYYGNGEDYFFRQADREAGAMSPMFLGGMTARAMQLRSEFAVKGVEFLEVWPRAVSEAVMGRGHEGYKKKPVGFYLEKMLEHFPHYFERSPVDQHEIDAALCWLGGFRYLKGIHGSYGDPEEGQILF